MAVALSQHPNAKIAVIAWEAASAGDVDTLSSVFAPGLVWHASGRGPRSGDYAGRGAVFGYLAAIGEAADRFDSRLEDVLVSDDKVAVLFHVSGERRGKRLDTDFILLFRIDEGRIAEIWAIPRDQHAVDEFWA